MEFRKDINGVRALTILGVLIFHFSHAVLPGGFSGVDVFFIISGFLMTKIIFGGMDAGNFPILKFYAARCRRIMPTLILLCFVLMGFGWFNLAPFELQKLSYNSIAFLSNRSIGLTHHIFLPTRHQTDYLTHGRYL